MDELVRVVKKFAKRDNRIVLQMFDGGEDDGEVQDPPFEATLITSDPVEIWLGSVSDAMYPRALVEHGITGGIINMASGQCKDIQRMELVNESQSQWDRVMFKADWYRQQLNRPDMQYLEIPAEDHPRYNISKDFSTCFEFIEQVGRKKSGGILVHCIQGLNRSAAVVVAYLVGQKKLSLVEAVEMVASKRPGVLTNRGFLKQLLSFEESLYQGPLLPELEPAERNIFTVENIVEKI